MSERPRRHGFVVGLLGVALVLGGCRRYPGVELSRVSVESMRPPPTDDPGDEGLPLWTRALQMVPPDAVYIEVTDLERRNRRPPYALPPPSTPWIESCGVPLEKLRLVLRAYDVGSARLLLAAGAGVTPELAQCVENEMQYARRWVAIMGGEMLVAVTNDWVDELEPRTRQAHPEPLHHAVSTVPIVAAAWTFASRKSMKGHWWPRVFRAMKELVMVVDTRTDCHVHLTLRLRSGARVSHELERIARSYARLGGPLLMFGIPNHLQDQIEIAAAEDAIVMAWSSANQTVQSWTFGETQSR